MQLKNAHDDLYALSTLVVAVAAGRELFYSATKGNCMQCHGPTALGDGQQTAYDN